MNTPIQASQTAFLFPGQGSQAVGMGKTLAEHYPTARQVYQQADEWLGFALSRLSWEGPKEQLDETINTQPALLAHSVAALSVLQELHPDLEPTFVAGHSMGELSALVACRALPYREALLLAQRRGELMKLAGENSPGGMAAVLGLDIPALETICAEASSEDGGAAEIVQVANDNCPGQVVISGNTHALERAMELAKERGARLVRRLAVSIPAHSPMMAHAQADFNRAVDDAPFHEPAIPLVGNVTALPLTTAADIRLDLQGQLTSRVRWTESIQGMVARGVTTFVEIGSGSVLTGLLKRIDRDARGLTLGAPEDFERLESPPS
jgi:[acyl-carrier-protein] S-malonyltransferase